MKTLILLLLTLYQNIISPLLYQLLGQRSLCRYEITCSAYAKQVIQKHGILTGSKLAITRIFRCQPFINTYANL